MCKVDGVFNDKIPLANIDKPAKLLATFFRVNTTSSLRVRFLEGIVSRRCVF